MYFYFKRSAIHNLVISLSNKETPENKIPEGLIVPKDILEKSDILPFEQIIVTRIDGDNWSNRINTFVVEGPKGSDVKARGSLASFLKKGDLTCIISRTILDKSNIYRYDHNQLPIFDLGFNPDKIKQSLKNNLEGSRLDIEFKLHTKKNLKAYSQFSEIRKNIPRIFLSSLILGLKINKTHPDCLQGSAELPAEIMDCGAIRKYQSVSVYNYTRGGVADTYAVPTPPGIVMTTGAMATFAEIGDQVNVAAFSIGIEKPKLSLVHTDGSRLR